MTRHRSPRGRGAALDQQDQRRHRTPGRHQAAPGTAPLEIPSAAAGRSARHRSPAGSALRRGALAAGVAGGALAVAGATLPVLPLTDAGVDGAGALTLANQSAAPPAATVGSRVTPAAAPSPSSDPGGAVAADLIKAVDRERAAAEERAEQARAEAERIAAEAAAEAEAQRAASLDCGVSSSYGGVADSVQAVGNAMECLFPDHDVLGVGSRGNASDHPGGYALDFMTDSGSTSGDTIAECVVSNADALGVSYVIWNQRINSGSGWSRMEDRGGRTANHEDHVHISFERGGSPDVAALRGCGGGNDGRA